MKALAGFVAVLLSGVLFAAEGQVLPARYLEDQAYFEGNWIGEGNIGDATVVIKFTANWVPGKHSLIIQGTTRRGEGDKEVVQWTLLSGCEVSTQEMVDCAFGSDGTSSVTRWQSLSANEQVGKESGIQDGKPYSVECKAVKKGSDRWTFSSTTADGKPVKIEYRREPAAKTN